MNKSFIWQIHQKECRIKLKFIAVIFVVGFFAVISSTRVHSQNGGGYTCGQFQRLDAGSRGFPAFVPFGFESNTSSWWVIQTLDGNLPVTSTGEEIDPIANYGRNIRIWNPDLISGNSLVSVGSYEFVDTCGSAAPAAPTNTAPAPAQELEIVLTADQTNLMQGQCTTLRYSIPSGWSLINVFGFQWQADGYRGAAMQDSGKMCPTTTTEYAISGNYPNGMKQSSVVIYVSAPPPQIPTHTYVPPAPPTWTPLPGSTSAPIGMIPSFTSVPPRPNVISTLRIEEPPATQSDALELSVTPITQRVKDNPITLSNGTTDNGDHDCSIAVMSIALEYFRNQKILNQDDTTNYRNLVPIVRGTQRSDTDLSIDSAFISTVTNNKLSARAWYTTSDNLPVAMETELKAGRPVVAAASNGNLLAAQWTGMAGHSILVYGLHDGRVYYVDPWDGHRYNMSTQDFVHADTFKDGSFLITFERQQK